MPYLRTVLQNVNGIADKMISNAHSRAVNLLANDGKDGAPFLDLRQLNQRMFSDFCPDNPVSVVSRLNESWHRSLREPAMVRMSTKQYPIGSNSSPLEEIDEIAERIFNDHTGSLPRGRATIPLNKNKGKGRGLPGAASREELQNASRGNWLAFPSGEAPKLIPIPSPKALHQKLTVVREPRIHQDLRNIEHANSHFCQPASSDSSAPDDAEGSSTRLEDLFDRYGSHALSSDRFITPASIEEDAVVEKVAAWRPRLIEDHKRRLTERWGNPSQTLRRVLPSIKQIFMEAMAAGYRPTSDDFHNKIRIIEAREQRQVASSCTAPHTLPVPEMGHQHEMSQTSPHAPKSRDTVNHSIATNNPPTTVSKKRQKTSTNSNSTKDARLSKKSQAKPGSTRKKVAKQIMEQLPIASPPAPHSSGSTALDVRQDLPPGTYFEPQLPDEKPAWRCGIKHAMGYYYNAGNRSSCPGCFTNIKENAKTRHMDFYLPTSTYFFQPAPNIVWTPSKLLGKARRSKHLSHNSIAKEAYWAALHAGETADKARQAGVEAVETVLRSRLPKERTPEPTPEPEPDLGPHPSGSEAMEHGQDIPECAYFDNQERHEIFAWRCDVNHALGRYYLAGDKRTCPGCGSNKNGMAKQSGMDFYMPSGVAVRQEARGLSLWKPRKPYKLHNPGLSKTARAKHLTHNQNASKKYFEAIDFGHEHEEAVRLAIEGVEAELEAKHKAAERSDVTSDSEEAGSVGSPNSGTTEERRDSANTSQSGKYRGRRISHGGSTVATIPRKRNSEGLSDDEADEEVAYEDFEVEDAILNLGMVDDSSSDDEETSESDSE